MAERGSLFGQHLVFEDVEAGIPEGTGGEHVGRQGGHRDFPFSPAKLGGGAFEGYASTTAIANSSDVNRPGLLQVLGDTTFENVYLEHREPEPLYREAIDLLVDYQRRVHLDSARDCICWDKQFDAELLRWELDHYTEWGIDALHGRERLDPMRDEVGALFDRIVTRLLELPQTLSLRDYQSRNIMKKGDEWVIIDFQDALHGPFIYDLVALLRDSYIELPPDMVDRLVAYYAAQDLPWCENAADVAQAFHLQTVQRKLKDAGRFIFIDRVKGNPSFLPYYEPSLGYVKNALRQLPEIGGSDLWDRGLMG